MDGKTAAAKAPRPPSAHPTTVKMVLDALEALKEPKGVPAARIKLYICEKYKDINPTSLKPRLRQALVKAIEKGLIAKSKSTEDRSTLMSRYRVLKQKPEKKTKPKVNEEKSTKSKTKSSTEKKTKVVEKKTKAKTASEKKNTKSPKAKKTKVKTPEKATKTKAKTPVKKTAKAKPKSRVSTVNCLSFR